jgi:hypothetical protein
VPGPTVYPGINPEQVAPTEAQKAGFPTTEKQKEDMMNRAAPAWEMQQLIIQTRNQAASGILQGGIFGSDMSKKWVNILTQLGWENVDPELARKLQRTQVFDALANTMVAEAVRQFAASRIAAREIPWMATTKPNTMQQAAAMEQVMSDAYNRAQRYLDTPPQAAQWLQTHTDLLGFRPTFRDVKLPAAQIDATAAPDTYWTQGKTIRADDGTMHKSTQLASGVWVWNPPLSTKNPPGLGANVQPPAASNLSSQVPQ